MTKAGFSPSTMSTGRDINMDDLEVCLVELLAFKVYHDLFYNKFVLGMAR